MGKGKKGGDPYPLNVIGLSEYQRESRTESHKEAYPPVSMCPGLMRNEAVLLLPTPLT